MVDPNEECQYGEPTENIFSIESTLEISLYQGDENEVCPVIHKITRSSCWRIKQTLLNMKNKNLGFA